MARLSALETTLATHLLTLGRGLEDPMKRLMEIASETPRAAAEVISKLRGEISNNIERDNTLLEERQGIMQELKELSQSLAHASAGQREAVEMLVNSSAVMLQDVGTQFTDHVGAQVSKFSDIADNFSGSATEMSCLGEAFSLAIHLFNESNGNLTENLARIEQSMDKSSLRSDEQMAYYVAQAREIIDHSMMSQKGIFDELRHLGRAEKPVPAEVD